MIVQGDARNIPLADASVQAVVTSPPYWGLRKYQGAQDLVWPNGHYTQGIVRCNRGDHNFSVSHGSTREHPDRGTVGKDSNGSGLIGGARTQGSKIARGEPARMGDTCELCGAWRGGFGLEPTIEMYIAHTVEILREIRRVLRPDGVVFWNVGDSYSGAQGRGSTAPSGKQKRNHGTDFLCGQNSKSAPGLKPKDLCLIPARVAIAAQADGWWVRSLIIWAKPNPMPESVTDRPTDSYEHIIMLTKSERYFWDADAVREPAIRSGEIPGGQRYSSDEIDDAIIGGKHTRRTLNEMPVGAGRNLRNVWTFPTQPYSGAHFATFPEEIPRPCILAATSEKGCCASCGAPWRRVTEPTPEYAVKLGKPLGNTGEKQEFEGKARGFGESICSEYVTVGWRATCRCFPGDPADVRPCLVLDPFGGSGTTARVAVELNRRAVSLDLAYHDHAEKRTRQVQRRLVGT